MKDYIDRESLRNNLRRWAADLAYTYGPNDEYVKCLEEVDTIVEDAPAADVVEVRHGRWVRSGQSFVYPHKFRNYSCSVCGYDIEKTKYNYCPNCGAKIDGGVDDGNS